MIEGVSVTLKRDKVISVRRLVDNTSMVCCRSADHGLNHCQGLLINAALAFVQTVDNNQVFDAARKLYISGLTLPY